MKILSINLQRQQKVHGPNLNCTKIIHIIQINNTNACTLKKIFNGQHSSRL